MCWYWLNVRERTLPIYVSGVCKVSGLPLHYSAASWLYHCMQRGNTASWSVISIHLCLRYCHTIISYATDHNYHNHSLCPIVVHRFSHHNSAPCMPLHHCCVYCILYFCCRRMISHQLRCTSNPPNWSTRCGPCFAIQNVMLIQDNEVVKRILWLCDQTSCNSRIASIWTPNNVVWTSMTLWSNFLFISL